MMAEPFTKKVLYNLLYAVRAKSEHIYVALGDDCDPAILKPYVEPGREIQHLFTYFLERITHDGKTTKEDLVKALNSQIVRHGVLARKLKEDQTITDGSVLTTDHLKYLSGFLHDAIGKLMQLAVQLEVDLDSGTVKQDTAFSIMIKEITENKKVTPKELAAALRSPMVGEGQLANKIEQEFDTVDVEAAAVPGSGGEDCLQDEMQPLKRELSQEREVADDKLVKRMRLDKGPTFKNKSHEKQFEFNATVMDKMEDATSALQQTPPAVEKAKTSLAEDPPRILKNPESQSKPYREEVSFTVTASGLNLCYQWRKDGQDLCDSGEYSRSGTSILFIKSFSHELEGNYNCIVKNSGGEIESKKAKLSFSVEKMLKKGRVPLRHAVYVERKTKIKEIREKLHKLKDDHNHKLVVIHGMGGFGKTVLAAEAVRDAAIFREVFPDGVNWFHIGQLEDSINRNRVQENLQQVIHKLDRKQPHVSDIDSATKILGEIISEQYPESLLILDDVWSSDVISAFAECCPIMVTSRNARMAKMYNCYDVDICDGLTKEEGREMIVQRLKTEVDNLSPLADKVLKQCRGLPLAIALLGGVLEDDHSESMWKDISDMLETSHLDHIVTQAEVGKIDVNYHQASLNATIKLSTKHLPEDKRECFEMLVVFGHDTPIPISVLETIWGLNKITTSACKKKLVEYSLLQQVDSTKPVCQIHDIILDYLKYYIPEEKQVEYHKKVIEQYTKKNNGHPFWMLPDDNYVYKNLAYHIEKSGNMKLLEYLLSNLKWLTSVIKHGAAYSLLTSYRNCGKNTSLMVQEFGQFLATHMDLLSAQSQSLADDFVQAAFLYPETSKIFCQAKDIVQAEKEKLWLNCNIKESTSLKKLTLCIRPHRSGVGQCQYSTDGTKVLSCGSKDIKLWESSTGKVVTEFKGHEDVVKYCSFSHSEKFLVSSSSDKTVKVWDVDSKQIIFDFNEHKDIVNCCAVSPDDKWVISCDKSSAILVWEAKTGNIIYCWKGGMSSFLALTDSNNELPSSFWDDNLSRWQKCYALSCAFSPDGNSLVTTLSSVSTREGTTCGRILVWNLNDLSMFCLDKERYTNASKCVFDGDLLATCGVDGNVDVAKVWHTCDYTCGWTLKHLNEISSCDLSSEKEQVVTGDCRGVVKVWSLDEKPNGILLYDVPLHGSECITCVQFSPDKGAILSADGNGCVKITIINEHVQTESVQPLEYLPEYYQDVSVAFDSSEEPTILCCTAKKQDMNKALSHNQPQRFSRFAAEMKDCTLHLLRGNNTVCIPTEHNLVPSCWVISNLRNRIVICYHTTGMIQLLKLDLSNLLVSELWRSRSEGDNKSPASVEKCYFSPDDTRLVTMTLRQYKVWRTSDGRCIANVERKHHFFFPFGCQVIFFHDNERIAFNQIEHVLIWSEKVQTDLQFHESTQHDLVICCIHLSEDNSRLIAYAFTGHIAIWDATSGEKIMTTLLGIGRMGSFKLYYILYRQNELRQFSCALNANGTMAVAGNDGEIKVWNIQERKEIAHWKTGSNYVVKYIAFNPGSSDREVIIFQQDRIEWWKIDGTICLKCLILKEINLVNAKFHFTSDFSTFITIGSTLPFKHSGHLYIYTKA